MLIQGIIQNNVPDFLPEYTSFITGFDKIKIIDRKSSNTWIGVRRE